MQCEHTYYQIAPPAGWRDDQAANRRIEQPAPNTAYNVRTGGWDVPQRRIPQPVDDFVWDEFEDDYSAAYCTPRRYRSRTARQDVQTASRPIVYAQYDPAFDPDLEPQPQRRVATPKAAKPAPRPAVQAVPTPPADDPADGELPPGLTPAAWLAMRHLVSVARKAIADPASVSYVPAQEEEPQLVVTSAGFGYAERFAHLEIRR